METLHKRIINYLANHHIHEAKITYEGVKSLSGDYPVLQIRFSEEDSVSKIVELFNKIGIKSNADNKKPKPISTINNFYCLHINQNELNMLVDETNSFTFDIGDQYDPLAAKANFADEITEGDQAILDLIKNERAFLKVVDATCKLKNNEITYENLAINFLLQQIMDTSFRPSRAEHLKIAEGSKIPKTNTLTGITDANYVVKSGRKQKNITTHHYTHTPKYSGTLLATDPECMNFYSYNGVGLLWDIEACDDKAGKYILSNNGTTNDGYWLKEDYNGSIKTLPARKPIPLEQVRAHNKKAVETYKNDHSKTIDWNELMYGLPEKRIDAIVVLQDTLFTRLNTLRIMYRIKTEFKKDPVSADKDMPIFIMPKQKSPTVYTHRMRINNILVALKNKNSIEYAMLRDNNNELFINIFQDAIIHLDAHDPLIIKLLNASSTLYIPIEKIVKTLINDEKLSMDGKEQKLTILASVYYQQNNIDSLFAILATNNFNFDFIPLINLPKNKLTNQEANTDLFLHLMKKKCYKNALLCLSKSLEFESYELETSEKADILTNLINSTLNSNELQLTDQELYSLCLPILNNMDFELTSINKKIQFEIATDPAYGAIREKLLNLYINQTTLQAFVLEFEAFDDSEKIQFLKLFFEYSSTQLKNEKLNYLLLYLMKNLSSCWKDDQIIFLKKILNNVHFKISNSNDINTALMACNNPSLIDELLSHPTIIENVSASYPAILSESIQNNLYLAKKLLILKYKSRPNSKKTLFNIDDQKNSLLHLAVANDDLNTIRLLSNNNVHELNSDNISPLGLALKFEIFPIVELLISRGYQGEKVNADLDLADFLTYCQKRFKKFSQHNEPLLHTIFRLKNKNLFYWLYSHLASKQSTKDNYNLLQLTIKQKEFDYTAWILKHSAQSFNDKENCITIRNLTALNQFGLAQHLLQQISTLTYLSNAEDGDQTIFHYLAKVEHKESQLLLQSLLKREPQGISLPDQNNLTPLAIALKAKHFNMAKIIYDSAVDFLSKDDINQLAFHVVNDFVFWGKESLIYLLKKGSLTQIDKDNLTIIDHLLKGKHYDLIEQLRSEIIAQCDDQTIAQILAHLVNDNQFDIAISILKQCKTLNLVFSSDKDGNTILHQAVLNDQKELGFLICEKANSLNQVNNENVSAFVLSVQKMQSQFVDLFLNHHAKLSQLELNAALIIAAKLGDLNTIQSILALNTFKFDVKCKDQDENTALHYLATNFTSPRDKICLKLLEKGASVLVNNKENKSPLTIALKSNTPNEIIQTMVNLIKITNPDYAGWLVLTLCQINKLSIALELLKKFKATNVNYKNSTNDQALHFAIKANHIELVQLLCSRGATIDQKNQAGESPLSLAFNSSKEIKSLLLTALQPNQVALAVEIQQQYDHSPNVSSTHFAKSGILIASHTSQNNHRLSTFTLETSLENKRAFGVNFLYHRIQQAQTVENVIGLINEINHLDYLFTRQGFFQLSFKGPHWKGKEISETGAFIYKIIKNKLLHIASTTSLDADHQQMVVGILKENRKRSLWSTNTSMSIFNLFATNKKEAFKKLLKEEQNVVTQLKKFS